MRLLAIIFLFLCVIGLRSQTTYFPPLTGDTWATMDPSALGWCQSGIDGLYDFLDEKETKAFIVLKDGRIVIEKYFGSFNKDSVWYWASAGKSITGFLAGMAQERGLIDINEKTSKYLGDGWTSMPKEKEDKITIWHHLTMTTGLEDNVSDDNCRIPACLTYKADAGSRWAYHNAPYRLVQDMIGKVWGSSFQNFMTTQLTPRTGIAGLWLDGVLFSKPRNMARFGLLMLNDGNWNGQQILNDQNYIKAMITPSQDLNKAYGMLWWLNGQSSFMLPGIQLNIPGKLIPNAPDDTWCALGKNDQKIYIVPSQKLVFIRMGQDGGQVTGALSSFDNLLWEKINGLNCTSANIENNSVKFDIFPNPTSYFPVITTEGISEIHKISIYSQTGVLLSNEGIDEAKRTFENLTPGLYLIKVERKDGATISKKIIKN